MIRSLAWSVLVALGVAITAPAFVPAVAHAATETAVVQGGLPTIPWQQIGRWMLKNALTLLMLIDEIVHGLQNSPDDPPPTPPTTCVLEVG